MSIKIEFPLFSIVLPNTFCIIRNVMEFLIYNKIGSCLDELWKICELKPKLRFVTIELPAFYIYVFNLFNFHYLFYSISLYLFIHMLLLKSYNLFICIHFFFQWNIPPVFMTGSSSVNSMKVQYNPCGNSIGELVGVVTCWPHLKSWASQEN